MRLAGKVEFPTGSSFVMALGGRCFRYLRHIFFAIQQVCSIDARPAWVCIHGRWFNGERDARVGYGQRQIVRPSGVRYPGAN